MSDNDNKPAGASYALPQVVTLLTKAVKGELPGILLIPVPRDDRRR